MNSSRYLNYLFDLYNAAKQSKTSVGRDGYQGKKKSFPSFICVILLF